MSKLSSLRTYIVHDIVFFLKQSSVARAVSISWCCIIEENGLQDIQPYSEKGVMGGGGGGWERERQVQRGEGERERDRKGGIEIGGKGVIL